MRREHRTKHIIGPPPRPPDVCRPNNTITPFSMPFGGTTIGMTTEPLATFVLENIRSMQTNISHEKETVVIPAPAAAGGWGTCQNIHKIGGTKCKVG